MRARKTFLSLPAVLFAVLPILAATGCGSTAPPAAPLLPGLGDHHHPVTTTSPLAQKLFDQGLILSYAFNHEEAARSFRAAAQADPRCALCYWGEALVLGPNINKAMDPEDLPVALAALERAKEWSHRVSEPERAYIEALSRRYAEEAPEDRQALDTAYAAAMGEVARRFPGDLDAAVLYAEALMDTMPWDYWQDGQLRPAAEEARRTLEQVLVLDPRHPGANHLYIHLVEAEQPTLGVAAADRLRDLIPGAGHLVHMPGHIYIRVGRYADAVEANRRAIEADQRYLTECRRQGFYPMAYMPHNHHFLWAAATWGGRSELALQAARHMAEHVDPVQMRDPELTTLQHYWLTPVFAAVRFGRWDEVLELPEPPEDLTYPRAIWRYARGMALARSGRPAEAAVELAVLEELAAAPELETVTIWGINSAAQLVGIARQVLRGELAAARGEWEMAVAALEEGVLLEDALRYDEPADWHAPVRLNLAAVLLSAGRPAEAERVLLQNLEHYPKNGWALAGLVASLEAQGKTTEVERAAHRFREAWQDADLELATSRL